MRLAPPAGATGREAFLRMTRVLAGMDAQASRRDAAFPG